MALSYTQNLARPLRHLLDGAISLVFPPHCEMCSTCLDDLKGFICKPCMAEFELVGEDYCKRCGAVQGDHVGVISRCSHCEGDLDYGVKEVVASGTYEGKLSDLIRKLKFERRLVLAEVGAAWLAQAILDRGIECDLVMPVPLSSARFWKRGFHQSEEIAQRVAKILGKPCVNNVVKRIKDSRPQAQLPQNERARNVAKAFKSARRASTVAGKHILPIDDVMTTGSTLREVTRVLRKLKASSISAAVVARSA